MPVEVNCINLRTDNPNGLKFSQMVIKMIAKPLNQDLVVCNRTMCSIFSDGPFYNHKGSNRICLLVSYLFNEFTCMPNF